MTNTANFDGDLNSGTSRSSILNPISPPMESRSWLVKLPAVMRSLGAIAVLFSLYSFLMRGWSGSSDVFRYAVLLAHTGLLTAIAFASAHWLKESKGPRLLLVLALVSASANFTVLGAFLYSAVVAIGHENYPSFLLWTGVDLKTSVAMIVGSLIIMVPVIRIAFRSLVRSMAAPMASLFLLSNLVLLIPVRDPHVSSMLAIGFAVIVVWLATSISWHQLAIKTREGMIAVLLQFLPSAIMLGRVCWLYDADAVVALAIGLLTFATLRQCALLLDGTSWLRRILEVSSVWAALAVGCGLCLFLAEFRWLDSMAIMMGCMASAVMIQELSHRATGFIPAYRILAGLLASLGALTTLLLADSGIGAMLVLMIGVGLMVLGYHSRLQAAFAAGSFMATSSLLYLVFDLCEHFNFGSWIALAIAGIAAIVMASLLESRGAVLREKLQVCSREYQTWGL